MKSISIRVRLLVGAAILVIAQAAVAQQSEIAEIKPAHPNGFAHAGWKYDRYSDMPSLDAGKRMVVADLEGPGIIRHLHTTRHRPEKMASRGVVLEIYFDGSEEPAVMCPLADFFGDGCCGDGMDFSTPLIECAPWSYNCYFAMPFRKHAKVILRNDTEKNLSNYSYVEWEPVSKLSDRAGYFHATYDRKCFQLSKDSDELFFQLNGTGHLIGRQFSVVTDEPLFRAFNTVMEGNNEVDIDGQERQIDYLGTEDSFSFSWGFQKTFTGVRSGMTLVEPSDLNRLSMYRFHDHMPIRFDESIKWHINWKHEKYFTGNPKWAAAVEANGCWVDYATVHYWYQDVPAGYSHQPLLPLADRMKTMLHSVSDPPGFRALFERLPTDNELINRFDAASDVKRVLIQKCYPETHPFWIDEPQAVGGHPGNPNPGRQGILAVHPRGSDEPCVIVKKVAVPANGDSRVRIVVSGDPFELPGRSDFVMQVGVFDGSAVDWFDEQIVSAGDPPSKDNWKQLEYPLSKCRGKTVGILLKVSYGGDVPASNEEAFFDEFSVVTEP